MNVSFTGKALYKMPDRNTANNIANTKAKEDEQNNKIESIWIPFVKKNQALLLHLTDDQKGIDYSLLMSKFIDAMLEKADKIEKGGPDAEEQFAGAALKVLAKENSKDLEPQEWIG